jgi:hypothetical protein
VNLSPALVPLLRFLDFYDQNSEEQRTSPLFLHTPNCRRPRISAAKEMSTADNLPKKQQKQQKQREVPLRKKAKLRPGVPVSVSRRAGAR